MEKKTILIAEIPGFAPLATSDILDDIVRKTTGSLNYTLVNSTEAASALLESSNHFHIFLANAPIKSLFSLAKNSTSSNLTTILVTNLIMDDYHQALDGMEHVLIDQLIANRTPEPFTNLEIEVTIAQALNPQKKFDLSSYLKPNTQIYEHCIKHSHDRESMNEFINAFISKHSLRGLFRKQVLSISEELLMNAIYDAPYEAGRHQEIEKNRSAQFPLEEDEYCLLRYAFDGENIGISVRDQFGLFERTKFQQYISKVLRRGEGGEIIDKKNRGAGLGLYMILYNSHSIICNVAPQISTEVISLINTTIPLRDFSKQPRSICYFTNRT